MSNYIAVDLKVVEGLAADCAKSAGVEAERVGWGLVRLWHRCWCDKRDTLPRVALAGIFGPQGLDTLIDSLVGFEFLEPIEGGWKVRGAEKYLRIQEGRARGGKAASGNLKRGNAPAVPRLAPGSPPADSRLVPGLSPNTEHRTPSTEEKEEAAAANSKSAAAKPQPPPPKAPDDKFASAEAFFAFTQTLRVAAKLVTEHPPNGRRLSAFWTDVHRELGPDGLHQLEPALIRFSEDKHWQQQNPPVPFGAFMSQWRNYVRT